MSWKYVGQWLKKNGSKLVALAGAVATGGAPAGIAAVASMVQEATGETEPLPALRTIQNDPATMLKLEEIIAKKEYELRDHLKEMYRLELEDKQLEHSEQQATIRAGDTATDEYVRRTRPKMARGSWYFTAAYVFLFELLKAFEVGTGAAWELTSLMLAPSAAYLGFRTIDKFKGTTK